MKISKYTYMVNTQANEVIFYNARIGYDSICKMNKSEFDKVFKCGECVEKDTDRMIFLQEKGHLIDDDINEDVYMKELYAKVMRDDVLRLIILPTEKCNFKCVYCYEQFKNGKMNAQRVEQLIEFVKEKIKGKKRLIVEWFGGEPLIEIDLIEQLSSAFMDICKKQRKLYFASITTNAYLLDLKMFDRLYRARILNYQITIDGTAKVHNAQRPLLDGRPTFETIMYNLKNISTERRKARVNIILRTNCMLDAVKETRNYLQYINRMFGEDKRFQILFRPVMDFGGSRVKELKSKLLVFEKFGKILEENSELFDTTIFRQFLSPGGQICYAAKRNQYTVGSDGTIFKCTCDFENKDITKIGDLDSGICAHNYCEWLLDMSRADEKCRNCYYFPVCMGDYCPQKRIVNKEKYRCPLEYRIIDSILKVIDKKGEIELHH